MKMIILIGLLLSVITVESKSIQREKAAGNADLSALPDLPNENEEGKSADDIWKIVNQSIYAKFCESIWEKEKRPPPGTFTSENFDLWDLWRSKFDGDVCDDWDVDWTIAVMPGAKMFKRWNCCKAYERLPLKLQDCLRGIQQDAMERYGYNKDKARAQAYTRIIISSKLPFCDNEGKWKTKQCDATECWCVVRETGIKIENPVGTGKDGDKPNRANCNRANFHYNNPAGRDLI